MLCEWKSERERERGSVRFVLMRKEYQMRRVCVSESKKVFKVVQVWSVGGGRMRGYEWGGGGWGETMKKKKGTMVGRKLRPFM